MPAERNCAPIQCTDRGACAEAVRQEKAVRRVVRGKMDFPLEYSPGIRAGS
jgi:hypothetical protein